MKKTINYLTAALFLLTSVLFAQPQEQFNNDYRNPGLLKMLNLTPDQEKQFKDIRYEQQKKAIDLHSQVQKNRLEIKHLIASKNFDEKTILNLTDANSKIQGELKNSAVKSWIAINKILTPEQQEIWAKHFGNQERRMRDGFKDRMKQKIGNRMHMRSERLEKKEPME